MRGGHWRSLLFCPGDRPDRIAKAVAARPGGVIVDLEDSVHPSQREKARGFAAEQLAAADVHGVTHVVRVNPVGTKDFAEDLAAVTGPWLDAVLLPKVSGPKDVEQCADQLRAVEVDRGMAPGSIGIVPVVEDCSALRYVDAIAGAAPSVVAMSFAGAEAGDFMADLGGRWTPDGLALLYPKSRFVCDVRAVGDLPAIDGPSMNLQDPSVWKSECDLARTLGFDGKVAIHPKQLDTINDAFMPTAEELEDARRVITALEESARSGVGVTTDRGRMLDTANGRAARRLLRRAGESSRLGNGPVPPAGG